MPACWRDGVRKKLIARLGQEAGEILDEFLDFCLPGEDRPAGAGSLPRDAETAGPEIKREKDQGRDEVRIMTVHAAKGLEAPVVFLVDGGSAPSRPASAAVDAVSRPAGRAVTAKDYLWRSPAMSTSPSRKRIRHRLCAPRKNTAGCSMSA